MKQTEILKAGNESSEKSLLTLYCECKLEKDNKPVKDVSLHKSPQNKSKILIIYRKTDSTGQAIYVRLTNSKTRDIFCEFKQTDISKIIYPMISQGKITIFANINGNEHLVMISNGPAELLQKCVDILLVKNEPLKKQIPSTAGNQPKKIEQKSQILNSRQQMQIERKRKLAEMYDKSEVKKEPKELLQQEKRFKNDLIISAQKLNLEKLPNDILGTIIEYLPNDLLKFSLISKTFYKISSQKVLNLKISNKLIPSEYFIKLLARFDKIKTLSLGRLPTITASSLDSFPVSLYYLLRLNLSEMSNLNDPIFKKLLEKTRKLQTLIIPYNSQITSESLFFCSKSTYCLENFSLKCELYDHIEKNIKISTESICAFFQQLKLMKNNEKYYTVQGVVNTIQSSDITLKSIELPYINKMIAESIVKNCENIESLKFDFVELEVLKILGNLRNVTKFSMMNVQDIEKQSIEFLEILPNYEKIQEIEIGQAGTPPVILDIIEKYGQNLRVLKIHNATIRDGIIEEICKKCPFLDILDISGCIITDQAINYIENLKLKKLVIEMEKFKLMSCRQELYAKFPNIIVEAKFE